MHRTLLRHRSLAAVELTPAGNFVVDIPVPAALRTLPAGPPPPARAPLALESAFLR
ncbi:hypothetical protein HK405_000858, partial [Cladochytrium tenue]